MAARGSLCYSRSPSHEMTVTLAMRVIGLILLLAAQETHARAYYGRRIGSLSELEHAVKGEVYAVDSRTLFVKGFSYDGTAPDAYFYVGKSGNKPHDKGIIVPNEKGSKDPLRGYNNKDLTLTLPDGLTLQDIAWISVWCKAYTIDFGHLMIPRNFVHPRPQKIDALPTFEHDVSSDRIVVVDAQTFLIPNFHYDGQAPDAFFWVGKGTKPGPEGTKVPDENGSLEPLKKYTGKTIVITLPGDLTVFDIDYLSVWCRAFYADFGHVRISKDLNVPPSLKMLGVAPQTKLNCEVLHDTLAFEVRWAVAGDSIVMQLVGKVENGEYMAFGLSGNDARSMMDGGDVTVAWLDQVTGKGEAVDYILNAKAQCQGSRGACPDTKVLASTNNVRLLNAAFINSFTMLTFQRPLAANDASDKSIDTSRHQAVIWAIGPVNSQGDTSYHRLRLEGDLMIDFGRSPNWNCPLPEEESKESSRKNEERASRPSPPAAPPRSSLAPWKVPPIPCYEPEDGVFYAQIGPTGGERGYNAITGHVGWGIAWYINGLLIPEINVVRGKTYSFVVEGGSNPDSPAKFHPFYITDDPEGGYEFKTKAEKSGVRVYAGVDLAADGSAAPTATGRLCEWKQDPAQPADLFESFGAYQRSLTLDCQEGQPGILQWTPDANTPDEVYYQCYTHRFLGWKINVINPQQCTETLPSSVTTNPSSSSTSGITRADYDYYLYDDYIDSKTRTGDVTLGGATRYEGNLSSRDSSNTIDFLNFDKNFEDSSSPFGFDSFPFDLNLPPRFNYGEKTAPRFEWPPTPPSDRIPPEAPLGHPSFTFPKLPSMKLGNPVVNTTAFSALQQVPFFEDPSRKYPEFEKEVFSSLPDTEPKNRENEIHGNAKIVKEDASLASRTRQSTIIKEWNKRRQSIRNKHQNSEPTAKPGNLLELATEAQLIKAFQMNDPHSFLLNQNSSVSNRKKSFYQNSPRGTRTSSTIAPPKEKTTQSFEIRKNPTENPVFVIAKPYNHSDDHNNYKNHKLELFSNIGEMPELNIHQRELNSLHHSLTKNDKLESNYNSFNRNTLDSETGLPYATNSGFDPSTVVFENDFRPLSSGQRGASNISFKVLSKKPHVGIESKVLDGLKSTIQRDTLISLNPLYGPEKSKVVLKAPQSRLDSLKSNDLHQAESRRNPHQYQLHNHQLLDNSEQALLQKPFHHDLLNRDQIHRYQPSNQPSSRVNLVPHQIGPQNAFGHVSNRGELEQRRSQRIVRPTRPALKLRPPPLLQKIVHNRFGRKMAGFERSKRASLPKSRSQRLERETFKVTTLKGSTISNAALASLPFFLQAPTPHATRKIRYSPTSSRDSFPTISSFRPSYTGARSKERRFNKVPYSTKWSTPRLGLSDTAGTNLKFDYSKTRDQLHKSATKATHLTILKDIWNNLTDEKTRIFF